MTAPAATRAAGVPAGAIETGAAVGAAGLALTSTGSMVIAAVLLGVAARSRWTVAASLLAVTAVGVRFSTVTFDDIAGIQSVLGSAGTIGPATAAASAWTAAAAVLLSVRTPAGSRTLLRGALALASGATASAVALGPGPGGDILVRVSATAGAAVLAHLLMALADHRERPSALKTALGVAAGVAAVVLAAWPA